MKTYKRLVLFIFFGLITLNSFAEQAPKTETYNSIFNFNQKTSATAGSFLIYVKKIDHESYRDQFIVEAKGAQTPVHLNFKGGSGEYQIQVLEKSSQGEKYKTVARFNITNHDNNNQEGLLASDFVQSNHPEIIALSRQITEGAQTQREAVVKINTWLINNIKYDSEGYKNKTYAYKNHDALSTLLRKETVCEGFANLFAALARANGIQTRFVAGRTDRNGSHAWNEVFIEDKWYNVDSTWDQNLGSHVFLFMDDDYFFETHLNRVVREYK